MAMLIWWLVSSTLWAWLKSQQLLHGLPGNLVQIHSLQRRNPNDCGDQAPLFLFLVKCLDNNEMITMEFGTNIYTDIYLKF